MVCARLIRAFQSFGVDALAQYIYGDAHLERMQRILSVVEKDPAFDKSRIHYMGRMEKYEFGVRKVGRRALAAYASKTDLRMRVHRRNALHS